MKNLIILISLLFTISSCCKNKDAATYCNVENPLEDLEWLKDKYDEYDYETDKTGNSRIFYYELFDGRELINVSWETAGDIYDCSGNILCSYGGFAGTVCSSIYTIRYKAFKNFSA